MSFPKFIFFIVEEDGRTRQVVNGVVTSLSTPRMLPNAPDGNQDISIGWERSANYYGNIRNFSLDMGFVRDGLTILRNDFYKFNVDRKLYLLIKRYTCEFTDTTFKEYYKQFYKGQFDFSTSEDDQGAFRFNVNLMDGGLQRLFKATETTKFFFPFDADAKNIKMDGLYIAGTYRYTVPDYGTLGDGYPALYQLPNDSPVPGLAIFDVQGRQAVGAPDETTFDYFAQITQDITDVRITGLLTNFNSQGAPSVLSVRIYVFNTITNTERLQIDLTPDDPYPENYNLVIDETVDLEAGDRLFLKSGSTFFEGNFNIDAKNKPVQSFIKGFTLYDLWLKMMEKIGSTPAMFESTLLSNLVALRGHDIIITSGDGVRGLTGAGVKTSPKDLFDATDAYLMAGLQIGSKIVIEERGAFFTPESVDAPAVELGEVKNLKVTWAIDFMGTSIKVGHAEQQVDDTNGKFDFNGWQLYTAPIKIIPSKEINIQSPYKAGPYEIEQTRANFEGKTTTDKDTDNDVFAIAVTPDDASNTFDSTTTFQADGAPLAPGFPLIAILAGLPVIQPGMTLQISGTALNNGNYTVNTSAPWFFGQLVTVNEPVVDEAGVVATFEIMEGQYYNLDRSIAVTQLVNPDVIQEIKDSVYNVPLSPKRMLITHYPWLAGAFAGYAPESLIFEDANRNRELIAGGIIEKSNVPIASLGSPLFLPRWFEFENIVPTDLPEIHETNPTPVFGFYWKGIRYTGFQWKDAFAASTLEQQTFKLLACPENDLLSLI